MSRNRTHSIDGKNHVNSVTPSATYVKLTDQLPLCCTRGGACCCGNMVWLNPWELARIASEKGITTREFRDRYCDCGGIRLCFDGAPGYKELAACSQYELGRGCSVHDGRPLACRLFPLGRERRGDTLSYMYRGSKFPCLERCSDVTNQPQLSVAYYLKEQNVSMYEAAQDAYLELMQHLADGAFALLLESGLAATGDRLTLRLWRKLGNSPAEQLIMYLSTAWIDRLMLPDIDEQLGDPLLYAKQHHDMLQQEAQMSFGKLDSIAALREASGVMMGLALHLGRGLGVNTPDLVKLWITTAKEHGARE
jgi:uncharacterized protein